MKRETAAQKIKRVVNFEDPVVIDINKIPKDKHKEYQKIKIEDIKPIQDMTKQEIHNELYQPQIVEKKELIENLNQIEKSKVKDTKNEKIIIN